MVSLQQHQVALGHQYRTVALDHDDDGLPGDVHIPDQQTVPGIVL